MTEQEIIQSVRETAAAVVREKFERERPGPPPGGSGDNLRWLASTLDAYRAAPDGAPSRRFVDWLIAYSREAVGRSGRGKQLHNLAVLRYIVDPRPKQESIIDALALENRDRYRKAERAALERLAVFTFGADGVPWKE